MSAAASIVSSQQTQNICITFIQCWCNFEDVFAGRKLSGVFYPILIYQIHYPSTNVSASVALRRRLILSVMTRHAGGSRSHPFMISLHVWYAKYISSNQIIGTGGRR